MKKPKAQIIATIGPASANFETLLAMAEHKMDIVRINFAWSNLEAHSKEIALIREVEKKGGRKCLNSAIQRR